MPIAGRVYLIAACIGVLCGGTQMIWAEGQTADPNAVPLTVPAGAPLHVVLTRKVPVKRTGIPVEGKLAENVYVFDRLVIPAGSQVTGQVS